MNALVHVARCLLLCMPVTQAGTMPFLPHVSELQGMCDASAAIALPGGFIAVADDEQNLLRIYRVGRPGPAVRQVPMPVLTRSPRARGEADFEGAARVGDRVFWISSHGCNAKGKPAPARQQIIATAIVTDNGIPSLRPVGVPYTHLLDDLGRDPQLVPLGMADAARRAPKSPGALNIEGLAAAPDGSLLIGFRNPLPGSHALVVPLLNPDALVLGGRALLGSPCLLPLGGFGIRSLERVGERYLVVAGPSNDQRQAARLYEWNGPGHVPQQIPHLPLGDLNPEALALVETPAGPLVAVLSDDGTRLVNGIPAKQLRDPALKSFRMTWIRP